jgi:hypothetical protein
VEHTIVAQLHNTATCQLHSSNAELDSRGQYLRCDRTSHDIRLQYGIARQYRTHDRLCKLCMLQWSMECSNIGIVHHYHHHATRTMRGNNVHLDSRWQ